MAYNLTESQKELSSWLVVAFRNGDIDEEFVVAWLYGQGMILDAQWEQPPTGKGALDTLEAARLIVSNVNYRTKTLLSGRKRPKRSRRVGSPRRMTRAERRKDGQWIRRLASRRFWRWTTRT